MFDCDAFLLSWVAFSKTAYAHQNSRRDISQVMVPIKLVITSILNLNSGYVAVVGLVRLARSWRDVGGGGAAVVGGGGGEPGG